MTAALAIVFAGLTAAFVGLAFAIGVAAVESKRERRQVMKYRRGLAGEAHETLRVPSPAKRRLPVILAGLGLIVSAAGVVLVILGVGVAIGTA